MHRIIFLCIGGNIMVVNSLKQIRMQIFMMNRKEFCHFLGIVEQQYGKYEKMKSQPSLEVALRISNVLNMSVNEIWELEDKLI